VVDRAAVRQALGITPDQFAIVNVGRFVRDKGQDIAVQALASLPDAAHLYLVGDPATEFGQHVQALAAASSRVHFLGYRGDVPQLLGAFDAYLSSSRREALGLSLVEGAAAALPTVATSVGGVPEVVLDGQTGLLVPSEDAAALAQGLQRLMTQPGLAQQMGVAARAHYLNTFTVQRMLDDTLQVYRRAGRPS
jgi:glycosyltransferase involved in cell wall biosynthesis